MFHPHHSTILPIRRPDPAVVIYGLLFALAASPAAAQDRPADKVILQPKESSSRIALPCVVLDYTGEKLTIRTRNSTQRRSYDAAEVVEVQTPETEHHVKGMVNFSRGELSRAAESFERAMTEETRDWVRRDILALLVRCSLKQGDYATAGAKFLAMWQSDQTTRNFKLIPLAWSTGHVTESLRNEAVGWLGVGIDASRLLGASHLLFDQRLAPRAEDELKELGGSLDRRIRVLAEAQLWRLRLRQGDPAPFELKRWQSRIDAMPADLRGGPLYVLGRAHFARQEYDRAAMALLWTPLVYDHDTFLAARACLEAGDALKEIGQSGEADALYREVTTRFAATPFADEAAKLMKSPEQQTGSAPGP